mmetsp:Transcript_38696/g.123005  ORF Transcript_38696/g.123005 Transcript_38696/m.123005 type:complete len:329 (-) Transcript_38696:238-1224(-)
MAPLLARLLPLAAAVIRAAAVQQREAKRGQPYAVAVFLQVGNAGLWRDMERCLVAVSGSSRVRTADVFVSTIAPSPPLEQAVAGLKADPKFRKVTYMLTENRGADQGQFLQQLQAIPPEDKPTYDFLLKMHTKSDPLWRYTAMDALCATAGQVDTVMDTFAGNPNFAMLGPWGLTFGNPQTQTQRNAFVDSEIQAMQREWLAIGETQPFPPMEQLVIVAGSMFWVSGPALFSDELLMDHTALIISRMEMGYTKGSCCQTAHAMERLIPTRLQARGHQVFPINGPRVFRRRVRPLFDRHLENGTDFALSEQQFLSGMGTICPDPELVPE